MKTRTISRILEGIFLFTLILMIYIMSIFNAKGQMMMDFDTPTELMLSYSSEESFIQERMMNMNVGFSQVTQKERNSKDSLFIPAYLKKENDSSKSSFQMPSLDLRRRRMKDYQAPSFIIPFN